MIYTACKYAPEELFSGFSLETSRLDPNPASFSCADGCAHPNLCGFAKAVIEETKEKGVRELIFTDCCDAMRRTYDVIKKDGMPFIYLLPLPHKTGEAETRLFASHLKALKDAYEEYSGIPFSWQRAAEACMKNGERDAPCQSHVSVMGAHGGRMLCERVRESLPGIEVRDMTCSSDRAFKKAMLCETPKSEEEFFLWYAGLLLSGLTPCMRMFDVKTRDRRENGLRGIIYHTIKFCDYYGFEYADIKNSASVPVLKIETDTTPQSSGQLKTRIEAFGETLGIKEMKKSNALQGSGTVRFIAGLDSGSASTDAVIMDGAGNILGSAVIKTGMSATKSAREALRAAVSGAGLDISDISRVIATGYGRDFIDMEKETVTEITCHARGAQYLFPDARTVIDIGGQDSKVIRTDGHGGVESFVMNDKCAAGTGRFLEMQARALGLSMEEMSRLGLSWKNEVTISNMCTVFAESEVVGLVARDTPAPDIIHGLNDSVAAKTVSLIRRVKGEAGYAMTGGVSKNAGVVKCLEKRLQSPLAISEHSQLCGAIGAALIGWDSLKTKA